MTALQAVVGILVGLTPVYLLIGLYFLDLRELRRGEREYAEELRVYEARLAAWKARQDALTTGGPYRHGGGQLGANGRPLPRESPPAPPNVRGYG